MITVTAPGKLMLMGEHAVVYGRPCLVTAVDQRLKVTADKTSDKKDVIIAPQVNNTSFVEGAIEKARSLWKLPDTGMRIHTESPFSGVFGFGSSSAVTVATLKAIVSLFEKNVSTREIFDIAYQVVLGVQKVGSGFDVAAASFGGTLYFVGGGKTIEPLSVSDIPLIIGYSGVKANTVEIIQNVKQKKDAYPEKVERIFAAITKLVDEGKQVLQKKDWERLGKLFDFNQEYLRDLGVSTQKLEDCILAAKKAGAYGAKLSGAGGGDCMIALAPPEKREAIQKAIAEAGGQVLHVLSNAVGVRIETTDDQKELFVVVDKDDNILGYKTRYECHHDKTLIHRTVGVLIFDTKGRLLLQKRSMTKDMEAGVWGISSAGHVSKGQTDEEAVHRELKEELEIDMPLTFLRKFIVGDDKETERAALFKGIHNGPFTPDTKEVADVQFFDIDNLRHKIETKEIKLTKAAERTLVEANIFS